LRAYKGRHKDAEDGKKKSGDFATGGRKDHTKKKKKKQKKLSQDPEVKSLDPSRREREDYGRCWQENTQNSNFFTLSST